MGWTPADIPDLAGTRAIVTGANAGLGLQIAYALAGHGAEVLLACRDTAKAETAASAIRARLPDARVETDRLDLADLDSVAAFADARSGPLHLLVNNAGLMAIDEARTRQGVEMQFGVNHLGHFALTARLLPLLLSTPGARVATMSSMGHRVARGPFDPRGEHYDRWQAYSHSKLANLLFTAELQRRLAAAGSSTIAVAAHPGASSTELGFEGSAAANRALRVVVPLLTQPASVGARPMLRALTDPTVRGGEFFGPRFLVRGRTPVRETPTRAARDAQAARSLWDTSAELAGLGSDQEISALLGAQEQP